MTDAFAILGLPRRAALDEESLRRAYADRSRAAHPDHGGSEEAAAETNAAFDTLLAADRRLRHLLELAAPADANRWRTVPLDDALMGLFSRLGAALEASAKFLARKARAQSALTKALFAAEELRQREALEGIGSELDRSRANLEQSLPALDEALDRGDDSVWPRLAALQAKLAYVAKWQAQVRGRLLELM